MKTADQFHIKLIHCGNKNVADRQDREEKNIFFMPMGIFPLADVLKRQGFDVEIVHLDLEDDLPLAQILDFNAVDAVGFDCFWINQSKVVLDTAKLIKEINPRIYIFLGGYSASLFAHEILSRYFQVDAVIRGDAESPIVELCSALQHKMESLHQVRNLTWRAENGKITANEFTYIGAAADMDKLDFAAVHLLRNVEAYILFSRFWTNFLPIKESPLFLLEIGRGCAHACTYCGGNRKAQLQINNRTQTAVRSLNNVIQTIKKAALYGFETFYTCFEFEKSEEWYLELFTRIKEEKIRINYVYGSWGLPSRALIDALSENFADSIIEISPETSDMNLRKKNKDSRLFFTNEEYEKCLDYAYTKKNIKLQLYFGYYLVGDTEETVIETLKYILTLMIKYPALLEIEYANFSTDPGSLIFYHPEKFGMDMKVRNFKHYITHIEENYIAAKGREADLTLFKPTNLSIEVDSRIRRKMKLLKYLFSGLRKTISYILKKTESPEIILSLIDKADDLLSGASAPLYDKIKKVLLAECFRKNIGDDVLIKLLNFEFAVMKPHHYFTKSVPCLYLDLELEKALKSDEISESLFHYIDAGSNKKQEAEIGEVEFQI